MDTPSELVPAIILGRDRLPDTRRAGGLVLIVLLNRLPATVGGAETAS